MCAKYVKCFDNREGTNTEALFEQVAWYDTLKDANRHFKMDIPWAKEHRVDQYIFKVIRHQKEERI
jgi:hypothetical protein